MDIEMNEMNAGDSLRIELPKEHTDNIAVWCTRCLVCEGDIPIYSPFERGYKICDKCKRAILKMRECMKED